jgi:hypothetical protein
MAEEAGKWVNRSDVLGERLGVEPGRRYEAYFMRAIRS